MGSIFNTTKMDTVEAAPSIGLTLLLAGSMFFLTLTIKSISPIVTPIPSRISKASSVRLKVTPICAPYASVTLCVRP